MNCGYRFGRVILLVHLDLFDTETGVDSLSKKNFLVHLDLRCTHHLIRSGHLFFFSLCLDPISTYKWKIIIQLY
jgi:hypothetical protein